MRKGIGRISERAVVGLGVIVLLVFVFLGWTQQSSARTERGGGGRAGRSTGERREGTPEGKREVGDAKTSGPADPRFKEGSGSGRTVRWPILPGEFGVPPEGTRIALAPNFDPDAYVPPAFGIIRDSSLVVENWRAPYLRALALGPNESIAWLTQELSESVIGRPAAFVRRGGVDLMVRRSNGELAVGVTVGLGPFTGEYPTRTSKTNGNGYVQFADVPADAELAFSIMEREPGWPPLWVGAAIPRHGRAPPVYTIPEPVRVSMPVQIVGSVAAAELTFRLGGVPISSVSYDAPTNRLVGIAWIPVRPWRRHLSVSLGDRTLGTVALPVPPADNEWSIPISIHGDGIEGKLTVVAEGLSRARPPNVGLIFRRLSEGQWFGKRETSRDYIEQSSRKLWPGRIRLELKGTRIVLGETEIVSGETSEIRFDAAAVRSLRCRADPVPGLHVRLMDVRISIGENGPWMVLKERREGSGIFSCGVLATTKYTLRARAQIGAAQAGTATVSGVGGGEQLLRFEVLPTARIKDSGNTDTAGEVFLMRDTKDAAAIKCVASRSGNVLRITGYRPGRYWLILPTIKDNTPSRGMLVTLPSKDVDLGTFEAARGSMFAVRVRASAGFSPPAAFGTLQREDGVGRSLSSASSRTVPFKIAGLVPGRYRVNVTCGPARLYRKVWIDGRTDVELTIDLRQPIAR